MLETQLKLLKDKDQYKSKLGQIMARSSQSLKQQIETLSQDKGKLRAELDHMQALVEELKSRYTHPGAGVPIQQRGRKP